MDCKRIIVSGRTMIEECLKDSSKVYSSIMSCTEMLKKARLELRKADNVARKAALINVIGQLKTVKITLQDLPTKTVAQRVLPNARGSGHTVRDGVKWFPLESAFKKRIETGMIMNVGHKYPLEFFDEAKGIFEGRLNEWRTTPVKVNIVFSGEFINTKGDTNVIYLNTPNFNIFQGSNLEEVFNDQVKNRLMSDLTEFTTHGSGWALSKIIGMQLNVNQYNPMRASSYIKLPAHIQRKRACVNVKNKDDACFFWAITSALFPVEHHRHPYRTSSYPHYGEVLNTEGMSMPVTIYQIPMFEQLNNVSINVYALEGDVYPAYHTKEKKDVHVNLLIISEEDKFHYVWIKDLSRLIRGITRDHNKKYLCDRCFHYCSSQEKLMSHDEDCKELNQCKVRMPFGKFSIMRFRNYKNKLRSPYIVYMDIESILEGGESYIQKHVPHSVGYYFHCTYDITLSYYRSYRGPECISWFVKEMKQLAEDVEPTYMCPVPMDPLTYEQQVEYNNATKCHICKERFQQEDVIVRDHSHFTGN